ncbi:MAG: TRAP transporter substrate-binding protein [Elusimicrobia bacterium]|nr:TRAP transporter substrate-binding protein [Elusimicrobiota bacterium]
MFDINLRSLSKVLPALALAAVAVVVGTRWSRASSKADSREIRFAIIDHRKFPGRYYVEAARLFKRTVEAKTSGRLRVTLVDVENWGRVKREGAQVAVQQLAAGELEMANLRADTVARVYEHRLNVFDMPYVVKDYAHAKRVIEGPIGERLAERLPNNGITNLAYTYSGGFRVLASKRPVTRETLRGLKVAMTQIPIEIEQFKAWGAVSVPTPKEDFPAAVKSGEAEAVEITWNCYEGTPGLPALLPHVTEMGNNFYVTMMLVNSKFLASLPEMDRAAVVTAAKEAAAFERDVTIKGNEQIKERHLKKGGHVATMPQSDRDILAKASEPVIEEFADQVGRDIIAAVRAEGAPKSSSRPADEQPVRVARQ